MGLEKKEGFSKVGMLLGFDHGSGKTFSERCALININTHSCLEVEVAAIIHFTKVSMQTTQEILLANITGIGQPSLEVAMENISKQDQGGVHEHCWSLLTQCPTNNVDPIVLAEILRPHTGLSPATFRDRRGITDLKSSSSDDGDGDGDDDDDNDDDVWTETPGRYPKSQQTYQPWKVHVKDPWQMRALCFANTCHRIGALSALKAHRVSGFFSVHLHPSLRQCFNFSTRHC